MLAWLLAFLRGVGSVLVVWPDPRPWTADDIRRASRRLRRPGGF